MLYLTEIDSTRAEKYIYVPEARTCRYNSKTTAKDITGLYTDEFSHCNIVIVYKRDETGIRISMTHLNEYISEDQIRDEIKWVGEDCERKIISRVSEDSKNVRKKILPEIGETFTIESVSEDSNEVYAVAIDTNFKIKTFTRNSLELPLLMVHPKGWQMQGHYKINLVLSVYGYSNESLDIAPLLFDGENWNQNFNKHDLHLISKAE